MRVVAYVYPGWHSIPERDESFYPGFTEWDRDPVGRRVAVSGFTDLAA